MRQLIKFLFVPFLVWLSVVAAEALVVGSYNIRYDNKGDAESGNSWPQRLPVIAGLIRFHEFDLLGTQEAVQNQLNDLQKLLPNFSYTGCGRDDGKEASSRSFVHVKAGFARFVQDYLKKVACSFLKPIGV